ncbi:hypothetical protein [Ramlibacter sp.]|uniref:hypothetical protein n=1 Tax=Ramlibacter sp. TaxID=1917967 RepID=UPI003D13805E
MKAVLLVSLLLTATAASAQTAKIWRCGNTYTNDPAEARTRAECKPVEGGNITVVEGTRVNRNAANAAPSSSAVRVATAPSSSSNPARNDEQKARDADARTILEAELKKAEAQREALVKEYNNGEPEKLGPETRNYQKYLDRVAELKASIGRTENDIAGIKRELSRVGGGTVPASR